MEEFIAGEYDVIIIGGGHAGVEAGLVSAALGMKTAIFTISLDSVANLACNPSIGGTAKGHLVREIDALGGHMGKMADAACIQSRMLNRGKGPAVHSLRTQTDRMLYREIAKTKIEQTKNLDLKQAEISDIIIEDKKVKAVKTTLGAIYKAGAVIIASGTYLNALIHVGEYSYASGPDGDLPADKLTASLLAHGIKMRRFKTGTPARVHKRSIDFSRLEPQHGEEDTPAFSFDATERPKNLVDCHIAYTNTDTHDIINKNLHRSPMYGSSKIEGVGPRYCPSLEDKVVRFAEKERHQVFVEPMGLHTDEMYLQGMSSSMPEEVQIAFYKTIKGFENIEIMRPAYAIEYDCADPTQLSASLEFKEISGLFGAGQFNGSSGYEEAAAQGLVAGINAAKKIKGEAPFILARSSSYIGTLIDDLVIKGCSDPYRMMTSRSEYRLILRQDNADQRLMPTGHELGLISDERYAAVLDKQERINSEIARLEKTNVSPTEEVNAVLVGKGTSPLSTGAKLADLIRRPQIGYKDIQTFDAKSSIESDEIMEQAEISIKYEGYIKRQLSEVAELTRLEKRALSPDLDYMEISGLRLEAKEKLMKLRPQNIGQASRISGVSPADISVLLVWQEKQKRQEKQNKESGEGKLDF